MVSYFLICNENKRPKIAKYPEWSRFMIKTDDFAGQSLYSEKTLTCCICPWDWLGNVEKWKGGHSSLITQEKLFPTSGIEHVFSYRFSPLWIGPKAKSLLHYLLTIRGFFALMWWKLRSRHKSKRVRVQRER